MGREIALPDIGALLGIEVPQGERVFTGVATLKAAQPGDITFLHNRSYSDEAQLTKAGACLTFAGCAQLFPSSTLVLISKTPYEDFIQLARFFYPEKRLLGIDPTAKIDPSAIIGQECFIGAHAVIGEGVVMGRGCSIGPLCTIEHTTFGDYVTVKAGARIGQEGFGFIEKGGQFLTIPHTGRVTVGDYTVIGANSCVDRGSFGDTVIGRQCRIDNLVQIAHNVEVGDCVIMAAQCGISGSVKIGKGSMLGGQVGISGHVTIAAGTKIAAKSGVMRSTKPGDIIAGIPATHITQWRRKAVEDRRNGLEG